MGPYLERPEKVGTYKANDWGLHDMHGNVWQWCYDVYKDKLPGGTDPVVTQGAPFRVLRGGSWFHYGRDCRSANRDRDVPGNRDRYFGFRLAAVQSTR